MDGKRYIANASLYGKDDPEAIVNPGETCEKVNPSSLPWLLEQGYIRPIPESVQPVLNNSGDEEVIDG